MKVTGFSLWKNVGYSEDSVNVPRVNESLPAPYFSSDAVCKCDRGDIFNRITTSQVPFDDAFVCTYISVTYTMNDTSDITVYGWIDDVKQISDTPNEIVRISFHIDYWRTYISQITLANGMVKRRPANGTEPPQGYPFRFKNVGSVSSLIKPVNDVWWIYFTCTPQNTDGTTTYTELCCYPVKGTASPAEWDRPLTITDYHKTVHNAPSANETYMGSWDETLGISPEIIQGVWILPVPPKNLVGFE